MILRDQYGNKVLRIASGEVLVDSNGNNTKILDLNTYLYPVNQIHKDSNNLVSQITDRAQGIPFVQSDNAKKPVYNYDGYFQFDGTDDFFKTPSYNPKCYDYVGKSAFYFTFWVYFDNLTGDQNIYALSTDTASSTDFYIRMFNSGQLQVVISGIGGVNTVTTISANALTRIDVVFTGTKIYLITNGIKNNESAATIGGNNNNRRAYLGTRYNSNTYVLKGRIYSIESKIGVFPYNVDVINGTTVFNPIYKPFTHLKRFANKNGNIKAFLSSMYLKDAVINSSDEITSIKDEQGSVYSSSGTNAVKITNKGLYFQGSAYLQRTGFAIGTNAFFIGLWVNNSNANDANIYQNSGITIDKNGGNYRINGNVIGALSTNNYEYVFALRLSGVLYYGINGVLKGSVADTNNYTLSDTIIGSNNFIGYVDDVLPSIENSIINPTGYSVGQKVFEPPRRRCLDSHILQFPNTIIQL